LEVRYVLQGSVERHDGGVDTNVQLINAQTGAILWADSVEVEKSGVRNIRKEVVNRLAVALNLQLISVEASRSRLENPDNPDAFDLVMQGWAIFTGLSLENGRTAQSYFDRALTLQPDSQPALVGRAATLFSQAFGFHPPDSDQLVAQSEAAAIKAIDLEPQDAHAHYVIARVRLLQGQIEAGLAEIENCLSLNSNIVAAHAWKGFLLVCNGKPRLAIDEIRQALTQSPKDTFRGVWMFWMGYAYFYCSEYVESVRWFERSTYWGAILLAVAAYTLMSEPKQAQRAKERLLSVHPGFTLTYFQDLDYVQHPDLADMRFKLWQALRESGLPE
jgi:tetratricopeptide (TPR) repeat protein